MDLAADVKRLSQRDPGELPSLQDTIDYLEHQYWWTMVSSSPLVYQVMEDIDGEISIEKVTIPDGVTDFASLVDCWSKIARIDGCSLDQFLETILPDGDEEQDG